VDRRTFLTTAVATALADKQSVSASTADSHKPPSLVQGDVTPEKISIVYNSRSSAETIAAQELGRFINRLTGTSPRLAKDELPEINDGTALFLVGRTRTMAKRIAAGIMQEPSQRHPEAYEVRFLGDQPASEVAFLGGTGIATLYAAYHYLEKYCKVGFFQDGDHIPRLEMLPVRGVNLSATPRFSERMTMNLTLYWYSAPWWHRKDWEAYIDWTIKNRFNILSLWDTPGEDIVWNKVWRERGVNISDSSYSGPPYGIFAPIKYGVRPPLLAEWRTEQSQLTQHVIRYARARGMRTVTPAVPGIVPPEFMLAHPKSETFELSWAGLPKQHYLYPNSRMYGEAGKAFLEEYNSLYGTDHLYWLENYLECKIYGAPETQENVCREIAKSNFRIVHEVDPEGVGFLSAWSYLFDPEIWTPDLIQEHLRGIPEDKVRVLDQWAEMVPYYKKTHYFFGRPWHFGAVYSFGGDTNLHGDMAFIQKQFREVVSDKRAVRCIGFYPNPETIHHNYFYYQFLAKLGWNPAEVDLGAFTRDYAVTRYGEEATPVMLGVLEELLASVYGSDDLTQPAYWHRLGTQPYFRFQVSNRSAFIPHLRRALERALQAKQTLRRDPLYLHDLNDIARQYLAELFNHHVCELNIALGALDQPTFYHEADLLEKLMDGIERLLSHDDSYWLSPLILKAESLPGATNDVGERARDILTLWAGVIRDYASRDYYELVQGYYRPRVRAYLQALGQLLDLNQRQLFRTDELDEQYARIEESWVKNGFPLLEQRPDPQRVIETAENVLTLIPLRKQ
jgi:alpha-N-acetylglucosaminidase